MKYIGTIVWSFLLSAMIVYVLGSMSGASFDLTGTFGNDSCIYTNSSHCRRRHIK